MLERSTNNTRQALVDWEAAPISAPLAQAAEAPGARPDWTTVQVPGHWQLQDPFAKYQGLMLYRCRFVSRLAARERMVSLRFGAVYYSARVWLNGSYLGEHQGYFAAFEFDVTDILAQDAENELLVEVSSPEELAENDRETIGGCGPDGTGSRRTLTQGASSGRWNLSRAVECAFDPWGQPPMVRGTDRRAPSCTPSEQDR
jgi:hypothetical protein